MVTGRSDRFRQVRIFQAGPDVLKFQYKPHAKQIVQSGLAAQETKKICISLFIMIADYFQL